MNSREMDNNLAARLSKLDGWLDDLGETGDEFRSRFQNTNCSEVSGKDFEHDSAFHAFNETGFVNRICYSAEAQSGSLAHLFIRRIHEATHAMQYQNAAALYATMQNSSSRFVLCPRDALWATELIEKDAYAKEAWMASALTKSRAAELAEDKMATLLADLFNGAVLTVTDPAQAMAVVAEDIFENATRSFQGDTIKLRDFHHLSALSNFLNGAKARLESGEEFVLVRMDQEDREALGASFGPNIFKAEGPGAATAAFPPLSEENQARLQYLDKELGIENEEKLLTLRQALAAENVTLTSFLAMSRSEDVAVSKISVKGPNPS